MIYFFYTLNILLVLSNIIFLRPASNENRFSLSLIQTLMVLPVMAGLYLYAGFNLKPQIVPLLLFSETVFALTWFYMAFRLERAAVEINHEPLLIILIPLVVGAAAAALSLYYTVHPPAVKITENILILETHGPLYIIAIILLISVLAAAWLLERFWRALDSTRRWEYKYLVVGSFLICGSMIWAASFRLTFMYLVPNHLWLLAALFVLAWSLICYATARHKLLNRKIFISRKIVYSFISPVIFGAYFFALGVISLIMKHFELTLSFVLFWLLVAAGGTATGILVTSGKLRKRVHYFISTHFYINKYEYRDEWLAFSRELQGSFSETNVVVALSNVLTQSLYTDSIAIWLGDAEQGYKMVSRHGPPGKQSGAYTLAPNDPLAFFLKTHAYFYYQESMPEPEWQAVAKGKKVIMFDLNLALFTPLLTGDQLIGLIGLGPEYTGGSYYHDDFDLLTALGTQAASALLSVRMAEKLAQAREREVWNKLSSFVLHDIKNAVNMLSLVKENAPHHIHDPQFQHDLLETLDDALKRMTKVQKRLNMLDKEVTPEWKEIKLHSFLTEVCRKYKKHLDPIEIALDCPSDIRIVSDPKLLSRILENLLLNSFEAGGTSAAVRIKISLDENNQQAVIEVTDSGPGIPEYLLPERLFEPYVTAKPQGSGIGLWQVKLLVKSLKGRVSAENTMAGGARFVLKLPHEGIEEFRKIEGN